MLSREAVNTSFIVYGLTWLGLEPMIYHTLGKHANHLYTTNVIYVGWRNVRIIYQNINCIVIKKTWLFHTIPQLYDLKIIKYIGNCKRLVISNVILNCKLWKESLNSDGQQFHQYQQNE